MELKNNIYVISLTHWDREWRFPFEQTRLMLVKMMDSLLDMLDNEPDYACFHMDGHTILLEDYCEARPENADRIRKHVESGKLLIGPWFVLPDETQMSGESLVRNFLWGERIGRKYGSNMKVGYTPTSWGQVSQMPQILNNFGIDDIIFYRGITGDQVPGNYYFWQGPDGSRLFGVFLGDYGRVCFFHLVDRPIVFDRTWGQEQHEWNLGGKPFRMCGTGSASAYHFYQPPVGWFPERIKGAFEHLENAIGKWETPYTLAMECDDSTGAFRFTPKIIEEANKLITNGKKVVQGSLPEFMQMAKEHFKDKTEDLPVLTGEMRNPNRAGLFTDLYADCIATRIPTKYANRRAEFALQRLAEPITTIAWTLGMEYPHFAMDKANYLLLQNHAHDSIAGCGRDSVNDDVLHRFKQVEILSRTMTADAFREIAGRIDTSSLTNDDIIVVVFNPLPRPRSEVVRAEIDIAKEHNVNGFNIYNLDGKEAEAQIVSKNDCFAIFNHPHELPRRISSDRWEFDFMAQDIPAMGYKVFKVVPAEDYMRHPGTLLTGPNSMANEHMEITINPNGTVDIVSKIDGTVLKNQNLFDDSGEAGDYWIGMSPTSNMTATSLGSSAKITIIEDGPLTASIEAKLSMELPVSVKADSSARETETREINITTIYKLTAGERFLRIKTTIDNTVKNHVLRALFPTGVKTDSSYAETPFDVVQRPISRPDCRDWREPIKAIEPHLSFVDLSDSRKGVAVLNRGLPQYAAIDDPQRTIALTLLRAHRAWNSVRVAHYHDQDGTQLQGTHTFEYAILPHQGNWDNGNVAFEAEKFNVTPVVGVAGAGDGELPTELSFLEVHGQGLQISAVKKGEWDDSLIVRLYNPTERHIKGTVKLGINVTKAEIINMMESQTEAKLPVKDNSIVAEVNAKKVITIKFNVE